MNTKFKYVAELIDLFDFVSVIPRLLTLVKTAQLVQTVQMSR